MAYKCNICQDNGQGGGYSYIMEFGELERCWVACDCIQMEDPNPVLEVESETDTEKGPVYIYGEQVA